MPLGLVSAEKLATFENLDEILANSEFIDSGVSKYHGTKNKDNIIRYDYFETPLEINGKKFIATFDVEVTKEANSYKLHKVVNEINLVPVTEQGLQTVETAASKNGLTVGVGNNPDLITGTPTQPNWSIPNSTESISSTTVPDGISLYKNNIADGIENVNKKSINNEEINVIKDMNVGSDLRKQYGIEGFEKAESFALPDDVFERVNDYAAELAKPLNDVQNSGIMETVTDEKALKEWAAVNKAYEDYVMKSIESADINEVEAARKAYDAARKRYSKTSYGEYTVAESL